MNKQLNLFGQDVDSIKSEMLRRRKQVLVHSCLYYQFNTNLIEDYQYDKIARRLAELQIAYPDISNNLSYHDEDFKGFGEDHCYSGCHLPTNSPEVVGAAQLLLRIKEERRNTTREQHIQKVFVKLLDMVLSSLNYYEQHNIMTRKEVDDFIRTKGLEYGVFCNKKWTVRRTKRGNSTLYFKISS